VATAALQRTFEIGDLFEAAIFLVVLIHHAERKKE
jgi:hypothetical protein